MTSLKINEIFMSLQGEGLHTGEPSIFVRMSGCPLNCPYCDTDWVTGEMYDLITLHDAIKKYKCDRIVFTGGEPLQQLTTEHVAFFNKAGYKQSVETNGMYSIPEGLDYVSCSPKVGSVLLNENFNDYDVDEFRFVIGTIAGKKYKPLSISQFPLASHYYVSPLFTGEKNERLELDQDNVDLAVEFVKSNPPWKLSVQQHKLLGLK